MLDPIARSTGGHLRRTSDAETDVLDGAAARLLVRGGALRFGSYGAAMALSVLATSVLTRHLEVARFGQYTTIMSLVAIVGTVTDAGMANIGTREYAVLGSRERDALMRNLLGLRVALTLIGALLAIAFALAAGYDLALLLGALTASLATVALVFQHTLSIPLTADLRLGVLSALDLTRQVLWVGGLVVLAELGAGVFPLLSVLLPVNIVLIVPTAAFVRGRVSARLALQPASWPPLLRATLAFSLATAVGTIYIYTAQIITSLVASRYESGVFAVSFRVFVVCAGAPGLLAAAALPVLARAARDDHVRLGRALQRIFEASVVVGFGAAVVLSAGSQFVVSVIAGPRYDASAAVLRIQAFGLIASFLAAGWSFGLLSLRLHRGMLVANAAALLVSVALTPLLASAFGARGAAVATICGEVTLALTALVAITFRRPRFRPQPAVLLKVVVLALCASLVSLEPNMPSIARPIVAGAVYGIGIVATGAAPREFEQLLPWRRLCR